MIAPIAETDNTDVSEAEPVTDTEEKQSGQIAEAAENASEEPQKFSVSSQTVTE